MQTLAIDVGSSAVKAAVLEGTSVVGRVARESFATRYVGHIAEVEPAEILRAVKAAVARLPAARADVLALAVMSPCVTLADAEGRGLVPFITHQDRRSLAAARAVEADIGPDRFLQTVGCRCTPGGIAASSLRHLRENQPEAYAQAAAGGWVLPLSSYLVMHLCGAPAVDPSNAGFLGLADVRLAGAAVADPDPDPWHPDLLASVLGEGPRPGLPPVVTADRPAGTLQKKVAGAWGLKHGLPVLPGIIDGSCPLLLGTGPRPGKLANAAGSSDVLAMVLPEARPTPGLLMRPLGVGGLFVAAATMAAAGSAMNWARETWFCDHTPQTFARLVADAAATPFDGPAVHFEPALAGDRLAVEQPTASLTGMTLATTRRDLARALAAALARSSRDRLDRLLALADAEGIALSRDVLLTGMAGGTLVDVLHRDWPGGFGFTYEDEATLRGLGALTN
ncbi:MAG: FGGY-family carbohydrate kinase [Phycisphaerae bacterium]